MADPINDNDSGSQSFSAEYVRELRQENASWRTKLRDLEGRYNELESSLKKTQVTNNVAQELTKRGINANPSWISLKEGETPQQAVDSFLNEYPQFAGQQQVEPKPQPVKPPIPPAHRSDQRTGMPDNTRSLKEMKEDPVARAKVRDQYRQMLSDGKRLTI